VGSAAQTQAGGGETRFCDSSGLARGVDCATDGIPETSVAFSGADVIAGPCVTHADYFARFVADQCRCARLTAVHA
jgi:hypothetical protein